MASKKHLQQEIKLAITAVRRSAPSRFFTNGGCGALAAALNEVFGGEILVMSVDLVRPGNEGQRIDFYHAMLRIAGGVWDVDGPGALIRWRRKAGELAAREQASAEISIRPVTLDELVSLAASCSPVEINAMSLRGILAMLVKGACKARYSSKLRAK